MHTLIVGITATGKTTLAKQLAKISKEGGRKIAVLEPVFSIWPCTVDFHTNNANDLVDFLKINKNVDCFIDESGETLCRDDSYSFLATRSRQYSHRCIFIAQRATQILPIIRYNCINCIAFRQSKIDGEQLAKDFSCDIFEQCNTLKKGEYIFYNGDDFTCNKYFIGYENNNLIQKSIKI